MKKEKFSSIFLDLWICIIFINSLLPGDLSSTQSGFIVDVVQSFFNLFGFEADLTFLTSFIRILAHFVEFAILGLLIKFDLNRKDYPFYAMIIVGFVIAMADETIQFFVPGRAFQLEDLFIDVLGVLTGILFASLIIKMKTKKTKLLEEDHES